MQVIARKRPHSPTMLAVLLACFFLLPLTPALTYPPEGSLRLSGHGSSALAGRLEVYLNGNWTTVCSQGFDYNAATVACKQMGLGSAVEYKSFPSNRYGVSTGISRLGGLVCGGKELHLLRCPRQSWNENATECPGDPGASIACSNISVPYNGEVRLMGGTLPSRGIAELYYNYQWAPLCARGINWNVSHALCRQMGYTGAREFRHGNNFNSSFWIPTYSCDSQRTCLSNCTTALSLSPSAVCPEGGVLMDCGYEQIKGLPLYPSGSRQLCAVPPSLAPNTTVRLGGCSFPWCDPSVGRVELLYDSTWGTVCDSMEFTFSEANVICAQLGFNSASKIYRDNLLGLGPGSGPIYSLSCLGVERSIADCSGFTYSPMYANCDHYDDTVLQCTSALPPFGSLVLGEGAGSAGALLMFRGEGFQAVCGTGFGEKEGLVACRQLGYPGLIAVKHGSYYNSGHTLLCNATRIFTCAGDEPQLMACPSRVPQNGECRPGWDEVGVICSTSDSPIENIYLTNTTSPTTGELHIVLYGESGVVCGDGFGQSEGQVACRQLGYGTATIVALSTYTSGLGPVLIGDVSCVGFEDRLDLCQYSLYSQRQCNTTVILNCTVSTAEPQGSLRLSGGNATSGQLQMSLNGNWVGLCGQFFTAAAANVACQQLGLGQPLNYCTNGCYLHSVDVTIYFAQFDCIGDEESLISCITQEFRSSQCGQSAYVGLTCDVPTSMAPSIAPDNKTNIQVFFGIQPLYFYTIVGSGGALLVLILGLLIVGCACLYKKRKQSEWTISPDPPVYDTPDVGLPTEPKNLEKEQIRTIVIAPMCMNVYEAPGHRIEPTPPPSYEEVERFSSS